MSSQTQKIFISLFALFLAALPVGVFGQNYESFGGNITLAMTPEFPRAHEEVEIVARGFSVDLERAEVLWYVNGALKKRGVGARTFSLRSGALGEVSSLTIVVESPPQGLFRETLLIRPAEVDVLWEADTYTPPFYKGKSLLSSSGGITLTAMPALVAGNGRVLDPEALVYSWEQDGENLLSQSGFGKQSITLKGPSLFQESVVSLEVSSLDKSIKAKKIILMEPFLPLVVFYEKHPLRGILYERALLNTYSLLKEEFVLRAEPYFFPRDILESAPFEFEWSVNASAVLPQKQNELVLRKEGETSGSSRVGLTVKDLGMLLQAASVLLVQY